MSFLLSTIFSFSIGIAAVFGGVRFSKIDPAYYPFLFLVWASLANEIVSFVVMNYGHSNAVNSNLFLLFQALLITLQFRYWDLFKRQKMLFPLILIGLLLLWIWESFWYSSLFRFNSYFIIARSFLIILMSISMINKLIASERASLLKNACFLICFTMLTFFSVSVLVEIFWLYGLNKSSLFRIRVYTILAYINLFCNLTYALAMLWIPMRLRYILLF